MAVKRKKYSQLLSSDQNIDPIKRNQKLKPSLTSWHAAVRCVTILVLKQNEGKITQMWRKCCDLLRNTRKEARTETITKWNAWGPGVSPVTRTFTVVGPVKRKWTQFIKPNGYYSFCHSAIPSIATSKNIECWPNPQELDLPGYFLTCQFPG